MRFSLRCVAVAAGAGAAAAFAPPSSSTQISMTVAPKIRPQRRHDHRLGYVRHEDEMSWQGWQKPPRGRRRAADYGDAASVAGGEIGAGIAGEGQHHRTQDRAPPPPELDYEDRVERRFSRLHRRERLRTAISYGSELDRQRRELAETERLARLPPPAVLSNAPIPIVNFRTNSDFPASKLPASQWMEVADHPVPFEDAEYSSCTRISGTTRVLIPWDDYLAAEMDGAAHRVAYDGLEYMVGTIEEGGVVVPHDNKSGRAYWLQSKLHNAIYGQVRYGTVLHRLDEPLQLMMPAAAVSEDPEWASVENIEWVATSEMVAIKEMSWEHIRAQRALLAEDPIKEVAAMQYLEKWVIEHFGRDEGESLSQRHHIMMPLDLLSDEHSLYSITPFAKNGRLLDIIESKSRFSEPEARYWMRQILTGLSCLKNAGVAHRDMSPENLMVDDGEVYIIDMGMCLRIPHSHGEALDETRQQRYHHRRYHQQRRSLILPQAPCGKWYYLSPEVCLSEQPFDGPAVDLWAAGVMLFIMLTGAPPWEEPKMSDENFKLMTTGHLVRILTERRAGLSVDAMDLLQRMLWLDPADRLSLEQVCAHPWMTHVEYNLPSGE